MTQVLIGDQAQEIKERYLTPAEFALRLSMARVTVYQWVYAGKIQAVKIGKFVRIPESELERLIQSR